MRKAKVFVHHQAAGILEELTNKHYRFEYIADYAGPAVSLTMPARVSVYEFNQFPPFFEGLLPEGNLLDALLRKHKLDRDDLMGQLLKIGGDVVGAVSIEEMD